MTDTDTSQPRTIRTPPANAAAVLKPWKSPEKFSVPIAWRWRAAPAPEATTAIE
jgi:hypothetical protein